jgi:GWxTD domain-containing protein
MEVRAMRFAIVVATALALIAPACLQAQEVEEDGWVESDDWRDEEPEQQGIPARGVGDIEFNFDSVSSLSPEGGTVQEFFLEVPRSQLSFRPNEDWFEAVARFKLVLKSTWTGATAKDERVVRIRSESMEEAARDDLAAVIISRFSVEPGLYTYEVTLTDQQARKWQLVHLFRGTRKHGKAQGYVQVRDLSEGLQLADPLVAREVTHRVAPSPYSRGDLGIIPNPSHSVGLFQPTFLAYLEVYSPWGGDEQRYTLSTSLAATADSSVVASQTQEVEVSAESWGQVVSFDVGEIPSGSYVFRAEVRHDSAETSAEVPLEVLWDSDSWSKPVTDLLQEMSLALSEKEVREFRSMSKGHREIYLDAFWKELDPTPGTAVNEVQEEFKRRLAYADAHYAETEKGIYTDRGMIYIRYGQPDDIQMQVMPVGDSSLDRVLTGEQDRVLDRDRSAYDEEDMLLSRPGTRREGTMTSDERAYEIWYYNLRGVELFPFQKALPKRQAGMKFVFVDDGGYGNFILRLRTDE